MTTRHITLPVTVSYTAGLTTHDLYETPAISNEVDRGFKTARTKLKLKDGMAISHQFDTQGGKLVHLYEVAS